MPPKFTLTYTFIDESTEAITTGLYRCTADEIAFERRYGFPISSRLNIAAARRMASVNGGGEDERASILDDLPPDDRANFMRSEWQAFFAHRVWNRAHPGEMPEFDQWIERVAGLDIDAVEEAPDPTSVSPQHASSPP